MGLVRWRWLFGMTFSSTHVLTAHRLWPISNASLSINVLCTSGAASLQLLPSSNLTTTHFYRQDLNPPRTSPSINVSPDLVHKAPNFVPALPLVSISPHILGGKSSFALYSGVGDAGLFGFIFTIGFKPRAGSR